MNNYFIDKQYIQLLKTQFPTLHQKSNDVWNIRCPICGDSKQNKRKMRGYFYLNKTRNFKYKCFNCGINIPFSTFIREYAPHHIYKEYLLEKYRPDTIKQSEISNDDLINTTQTNFDKLHKLPGCIPISNLDDNHKAKQYVITRKIPSKYYNELFYSENFKYTVDSIVDKYNLIEEERIVIPFFDKNDNIFALQGRSLENNPKIKYITIRFDGDNKHKLPYGINRYDKNNLGYVVEGPLDSLFLPNCLAVASANLTNSYIETLDKSKIILVFDNETRNKDIVKKMETSIKKGFRVCIWNSNIIEKDINDMFLSNIDVVSEINNSSFVGLTALLKLQQWKRCTTKYAYQNKKRNYRNVY